jgi:hypothetical protein
MDKRFTVHFSGEFWYTRRDADGYPLGSPALGLARGMSWSTAFAVAQSLRDMGYWDTVICDDCGLPVVSPNKPDARALYEARLAWMPS